MNRTNALAWWENDLYKFEQFELCNKHYPGRKQNTLTGVKLPDCVRI